MPWQGKRPIRLWDRPRAGGIRGSAAIPGGLPSAPPERGVSPRPQNWEQVSSRSAPSLSSTPPSPARFHTLRSLQDPTPVRPRWRGGPPAAWEQPQICPFWGGSTPHTPVLGWNPGRAARMCLGQEEEGVGGRTERTEPSHGGKSRILENPFWVCFSKLSLFPTHFFFFFSGATSSGATTKPSSVPRVPAVLPPRSRPAELRRFSFFPIIIIIIISNAGCNKKNQLFPPKEASVVPPGPCPSVHDLPTERLHSHGTGSLAKKTAGKNQDPRKKEKHLPRSSGSRGGQWESKGENPAGSPPKNAKGITESPQSKVSDSPGRMGVFRDSGGK